MQSEPVSHAMEQGPNDAFGRGVFAANAAHVPTASRATEAILRHEFIEPQRHGGTEGKIEMRESVNNESPESEISVN
jgi:hypothetical protein